MCVNGTGATGRTVRIAVLGNSFPLGHKCDKYPSAFNYVRNQVRFCRDRFSYYCYSKMFK